MKLALIFFALAVSAAFKPHREPIPGPPPFQLACFADTDCPCGFTCGDGPPTDACGRTVPDGTPGFCTPPAQ